MTENILFDNIYVGHSVDDAKALAERTYEIKHALEEALDKAAAAAVEEEEAETPKSFKEDPVSFIRQKLFAFLEVAKVNPILAFQTQPETGAAIGAAVVTLIGMVLSLAGAIGSAQAPVTKVRYFCGSLADLRLKSFSVLEEDRRG